MHHLTSYILAWLVPKEGKKPRRRERLRRQMLQGMHGRVALEAWKQDCCHGC